MLAKAFLTRRGSAKSTDNTWKKAVWTEMNPKFVLHKGTKRTEKRGHLLSLSHHPKACTVIIQDILTAHHKGPSFSQFKNNNYRYKLWGQEKRGDSVIVGT